MFKRIVALILQPYLEAVRTLSYRVLELAKEVERLQAENATLRLRLEKVEELINLDKQ